MTIASTEFLLALMLVAGTIFFLPRGLPRQILLACCNAGFLFLCIPNLTSAIALAIFILSGFLVGEWTRRNQNPRARYYLVAAYLIALLNAFVVLKEYQFLSFIIHPGTISRWVSIVGLSYMLFRQIHYVVDISEGQIECCSLWAYLNYQLDLFALYAGPIQRFQHFSQSWNSTAPILLTTHQRLKSFARLFIGILKVSLLGVLALKVSQRGSDEQIYARSLSGLTKFALLFYFYPAYIYFNFSGYCDVVIAGAAMVGIELPENFNAPYLARNPIDFWARWHMTLTHWIRDYVFTPLYKKGVEGGIMRPQRWSYLCFFIAMFLAGVWHGSTWNFAVFGLLHGCGVSVAKMWEERIIRRGGRPALRNYLKSKPIRVIAIVATVNFVCFTMLFFPTDLTSRLHFLRSFLLAKPVTSSASVFVPGA